MRIIKPTIYISEYSEGEAKDGRKRLRDIHHATWKAANEIVSGQYFNDVLMSKLRTRQPDMEKSELEDRFKGMFDVKRQATTERDIKAKFPEIPPCVTNRLNNDVVSLYRKEKAEVMKGNRAVRNFKRDLPIPVSAASIGFGQDEKGFFVIWSLSRKEKMTFRFALGSDRANYRGTLDKIVNGGMKYYAPSFIIDDKKIFLASPIDDGDKTIDLDDSLSVGVDLGINIPACCALSKGEPRLFLGSRDDFLRVRTQMQARRRSAQKHVRMSKGGRGRNDKLSALDRYTEKERNFVKQYNHMISYRVVNFAISNRAGVIKLECLEGFSKEDKSNFILRNWSYFELQTQIKYKAERYGIKVVMVDPYHTSQTCSKCGNYEKGQRISQAEFVCLSCGHTMNADYNAALNIARSEKIVSSAMECEYQKIKLREKSLRVGTHPKGEGLYPTRQPAPRAMLTHAIHAFRVCPTGAWMCLIDPLVVQIRGRMPHGRVDVSVSRI